MAEPTIEVHRNDADQRYEISIDGERVGLIDFRAAGDGLVALPHTEVDPNHRGQGLAEQLVTFALDDVRERELKVVSDPLCPYIRTWFRTHPETQDLKA